MTALVVRRETGVADPTRPPPPIKLKNDDWAHLAASGRRLGPEGAKVTIVEFSDFQCPFCARLELTAITALRAKYPRDVAVVFRHWPLPIHQYSEAAAVAAECAGAQGHFEEFANALFREQATIGTRPFPSFAKQAGITDSSAFEACRNNPATQRLVDGDAADARALGAHGTPTVIVNGWWFQRGMDPAKLDSVVRAHLQAAGH